MKIKEFTPESLPPTNGKGKLPTVSFTKNGVINFNKSAMQFLQIKPGDGVIIIQDEENPGDWYIEKNVTGFAIRANRANTACFNSRALVYAMADACGWDKTKTNLIPIAGQVTKLGKRTLYGLLTVAGKR